MYSYVKCNFFTDYNHGSFTIPIESLKSRNNSKIIPVIYFEKCEYEFFEYYTYYHFSLEAVLQGMAKNNPTGKQVEAKIKKRH